MFQIKRNLLFNVLSLIVNTFVGFLYTPFLVQHLGLAAYGIVPLAITFNYFGYILTNSITLSMTRYYVVESQRRKYYKASIYLSTTLWLTLFFILLFFPFFVYFVNQIDEFLTIPNELLYSSKVLFFCALFSVSISWGTSYLSIPLYANNRFDLLNCVNIIRAILKLGITLSLFLGVGPDIKYIGFGLVISESIGLGFSFFFYRREKNKSIKVRYYLFNSNSAISLAVITLFLLIHQVGDIVLYKFDIILVNKFWSTIESGILGPISDLGTYIIIIISAFSTLFGPLILLAFSHNKHNQIKKMVIENVLIVGVTTSILTGLLMGFSMQFLKLWVGDSFANYSIWLKLKLVILPFYSTAGIFAYVFKSWNLVKFPAIITLVLGIINCLVSIVICRISGGDIQYINYILLFSGICGIFQTYALGVFMFKRIYKDASIKPFLIIPMKFVLVLLFVNGCAYLINKNFIIDNWLKLFVCFISIGLLALLLSFIFLLSKESKNYVKQYFMNVSTTFHK